jgi:hypothetical protein
MEVHAHSHMPTGRGKKWTHYFWEFLMLFLAVFCGFMAENFREHQVETTSLTNTIIRANAMERGLDSLKNYLYDIENIKKNTPVIYRQNATYTRNIIVSLSDQTATQLRNSGAMRLIRKRNVADNISRYWRNSIRVENTLINFNAFIAEKAKSEDIIFNRKFYKMISRLDSSTTLSNYSENTEALLMTDDKNLLISYANYTDRLQKFIEQYVIPQITNLKSGAKSRIELIKKEYGLQ